MNSNLKAICNHFLLVFFSLASSHKLLAADACEGLDAALKKYAWARPASQSTEIDPMAEFMGRSTELDLNFYDSNWSALKDRDVAIHLATPEGRGTVLVGTVTEAAEPAAADKNGGVTFTVRFQDGSVRELPIDTIKEMRLLPDNNSSNRRIPPFKMLGFGSDKIGNGLGAVERGWFSNIENMIPIRVNGNLSPDQLRGKTVAFLDKAKRPGALERTEGYFRRMYPNRGPAEWRLYKRSGDLEMDMHGLEYRLVVGEVIEIKTDPMDDRADITVRTKNRDGEEVDIFYRIYGYEVQKGDPSRFLWSAVMP